MVWRKVWRRRQRLHYCGALHDVSQGKLFGDDIACARILLATNPGAAKAIGREVVGFNQEVWDERRFEIVLNANLAKFAQHTELKSFLLNTGNRILVEASPVDKVWGIGLAQDHPESEIPRRWKGLNLLGFALMEVRDRLRKDLWQSKAKRIKSFK